MIVDCFGGLHCLTDQTPDTMALTEGNRNITLVISSLGAGGAERAISILANALSRKGYAITIITTARKPAPPFYELEETVRFRPLFGLATAGCAKAPLPGVVEKDQPLLRDEASPSLLARHPVIRSAVAPVALVRLLFRLRAAVAETNPCIVISFIDVTNICTLLATIGLKTPVIVAERTNPNYHRIGRFWTWMRRRTYSMAAALVVQTVSVSRFFSSERYGWVRVIPNPAVAPRNPVESGSAGCARTGGRRSVLAMGRFTAEKQFDKLINVFAQVAESHPEWTLEIWGDGPLRPLLEAFIKERGMQERITLPGQTQQPFQKMREAELFVLSSRYEGFPNVLCEAMACGLPVISFNCPSGPADIIRDGVDGVLVPPGDVEALARQMDRLMGDEEERQRLAARAPEVLERFGLEKVMEMWEAVIEEVLERQGGRRTPHRQE